MGTLEDKIEDYIPCQGEQAPQIDQTRYKEVDTVNLYNLPQGTIVLFKGTHPASNYIIEVLGSSQLNSEQEVKLWYVGSDGLTKFGTPACFIGPGTGCLKTKAKNLASFKLGRELFRDKKTSEGILKKREEYLLPLFSWKENKELYANYRESRIETYTKIRIPTELRE